MARPCIRLRDAALLLASMYLLSALHFIHPNRRENVHTIHLAGPVSYAFNADSAYVVWLTTAFPQGLMARRGETFRMRPLYPAVGRAIYGLLYPLNRFIPEGVSEGFADRLHRNPHVHLEIRTAPDAKRVLLTWIALIIENQLVIGLSLVLIGHCLLGWFDRKTSLLLTLILASHPDTLDFLWVPHTEAYNLALPALTLWAIRLWSDGKDGRPLAAIAGIVLLAKGLFYILANWIAEYLWIGARPGGWRRALAATGLLALPTVVYMATLRLLHVPWRSGEVQQYRDFVWMADCWRAGHPWQIPVHWAATLLYLGRGMLADFPVSLGAIALLLCKRPRGSFRLDKRLCLHLAVYTASCLAFWMLCGYFAFRLSIVLFPEVVLPLGYLAADRTARPGHWIAAVVLLTVLGRLVGLDDLLTSWLA